MCIRDRIASAAVNEDHQNPVTAVAAKNRAWREGEHVQLLCAHLRDRPAGGAGTTRNGHLVHEQLSEDPGRRVAVQPQLSLVHPNLQWVRTSLFSHGLA